MHLLTIYPILILYLYLFSLGRARLTPDLNTCRTEGNQSTFYPLLKITSLIEHASYQFKLLEFVRGSPTSSHKACYVLYKILGSDLLVIPALLPTFEGE